MSSYSSGTALEAPPPDDPRYREPEHLTLSDDPVYPGHKGAADWCRNNGIPGATVSLIKRATERGELPRYLIGNRRYYSSRDLWRWAQGTRGTVGPTRETQGRVSA